MSFFKSKGARGGAQAGSKRKKPGGVSTRLSRGGAAEDADELIPSDDSEVEGRPDAGYESDELDPDKLETPDQKRLRLAKAYLEEIEKAERERGRDEASLREAVNLRLRDDNLEEAGKLKREVADRYEPIPTDRIRYLRDKHHKLAITCLVTSSDGRHLFTASKDSSVLKWDLATGQKLLKAPGGRRGLEGQHKGHCSCINAMAISSDNQFLATGDNSKLIHIWNPDTFEIIKTFQGHRDAISGLAFRRKTHSLYSASLDRAVKIWNLDEKAYVETLFGHQDKITGIDAGLRERAVTSGGRDGSVRIWKIVEESQLVYNGPASSTDAVKLINEDHFVTAGEDGHLALWSVMKKKPLCTVDHAHGLDPVNSQPFWITSIATLIMTDLLAT
eukprot:maker-scaffold245_size240363-snap-gene-1.25 protein:Tk06010 transcript:maker-scaffold245_size240363-snap-gene-1.25-mRNA-1 annotation:"u3 small nucleolar rna-interacting protein 2"